MGWWNGSSGNCLASMRPSVQNPMLPKKKKKEENFGAGNG
jgi:hypothetical protein